MDQNGTIVAAGAGGAVRLWDTQRAADVNDAQMLGSQKAQVWQLIYRDPLVVSGAYDGSVCGKHFNIHP